LSSEGKQRFRVPLHPKGILFGGPDAYEAYVTSEASQRYKSLVDKLRAFIGQQAFVVESTAKKQMEVPLFLLRSPDVRGSKVTYSEALSEGTEGTWGVKILGTGMGGTTAFKVQHSATFESSDGDAKLIFVPVTLVVSKVAVYKKGKFLSRGLRCEMEKPDRTKPFNKRVSLIAPQIAATQLTRANIEGKCFPAAWRTVIQQSDLQPGVARIDQCGSNFRNRAFDLATTTKAAIKQERKVTISFELPGGHDYRLKPLADSHGIWWGLTS
jgi:hypothetical protein